MSSILALVGLLVLAGLGLLILIHHFFDGECLPQDLWREWRLSRISLMDLDRAWTRAPNKSDLVVSLTTIPSRIDDIEWALKGLLAQRALPAKIVLNIPEFSTRENVAYHIPSVLQSLASVEINRCEDWGPATKIIPTLQTEDPDTKIVVVDDDRIYPKFFLGRLQRMSMEMPNVALTMSGWVVPEDLTDRPTTIWTNLLMRAPTPIRASRLRKSREIDVLLGVFGYLVQPRFFDIDEMMDFSKGPEALRFVDDVRTSALCKVPKFVIPAPSLSFIPKQRKASFQSSALGKINRGSGGNENRHNTIGIKHYADRWRIGGKSPSGTQKAL